MGLTFDGHVNKGWSDHDNLRNPFCHIILPVTIRFKYCCILLYVFSLEKGFLPILQSCHFGPSRCNWQSGHPDWHRVISDGGWDEEKITKKIDSLEIAHRANLLMLISEIQALP